MLLAPTGLTLTLLHGGVRVSWTPGLATDNVEVYGKSDSGSYSLLGTITSGTIQYEDFLTSVDLRYYRLRAINGTRYSVYCTEQSVAMLGSELIANGTFGDATGWSLGTGWTISSGQLHFNGLAWTQAAYNLTLVIGHQYKMVIDVSNYATSATIYNGGGMIPAGPTFANGTITKWCGPSISAPYIAIVSTTDGSMDCDNLSIKENYAYGIPPSNLTVSWENDYAVMDFIDNSGGTLKHEIYEAEGVGAYNLVATLNEGVTHYHNYTSQGVMMHYRVRAIINSFVSEYTGYSNVVDYETPLVFQTDQSPVSAELDLYLDLVSVYGSTAVTIDWGDGTTPTVYTPPFSAHIYKTYTVAQDPYYVKIWGGGIITTLFMPVNAVIKGNLSKWKRSFLNLQIAYTSADSLPEVSTGAWGFAVDNYYANTHLSTYPRGEFITLDYYYARGGYASQAEVDAIYADLNTYYATHTPTKNIAIRINGGYYQVTGGDANADVIGIKAKFTAAGFTATIFTTA
jgi:hypothetical protein